MEEFKEKLNSFAIDLAVNKFGASLISSFIAAVVAYFGLDKTFHQLTPGWKVIVLLIPLVICLGISWFILRQLRETHRLETKKFEIESVYIKGRVPDHIDSYREVRAGRKPLSEIPIVTKYFAKSGHKDIEIKALGFGTIRSTEASQLNSLKALFAFTPAVKPGDIARAHYRIKVKNNKEQPPPLQAIKAIYGPIKEAKVTIQFAADALPKQVWRTKWPNGVDDKPLLTLKQLQPVAGNNTYTTTFKNLPGGRIAAYGIYWTW